MKVALISSRFSYFALHWKTLIENLDSQGHEIIFISKIDINLENLNKKNNHKIIDIDINRSSLGLISVLREMYRLNKIIKNVQPDIIHSFYLKPSFISLYASVVANKNSRFFFHITGLGYLGNSKNLKSKISFFLTKFIFSFSFFLKLNNKIIVETLFLKSYISKNFYISIKKIYIINGVGIDTDYFLPSNKQKDNNIRFLMVSRLLKDKGVMEFHEASKFIIAQNPNIEFSLIGDLDMGNPLSISIKDLSEIKNGPIKFLGKQKYLVDHYKNYNVFVLPSYHEGLSVSSMEAGSSGLCLLLSDIPGCRELVIQGKNGYTFQPGSSNALIEAMKKVIINREEISVYGEESREIIKKSHSKKIIISQLNTLYSEKIL